MSFQGPIPAARLLPRLVPRPGRGDGYEEHVNLLLVNLLLVISFFPEKPVIIRGLYS